MELTQPQKISNFNLDKIRADFPIFSQTMHGKPLAYLDNAATTQKPQVVLNAMMEAYQKYNANVHRGVYQLCAVATERFEAARDAVQQFLNAKNREEIIFVRGTTEAINLVAHGLGKAYLQAGDEIVISSMEHHANIVPWQQLRDQLGVVIRVIPLLSNGDIDLLAYQQILNKKTRLVSLVHVSNVYGAVNPIQKMIAMAKQVEALVLIDGAQAVMHMPIDVQALDCDFYAFSGHKVLGPNGIGVLYGKRAWLERMPPYQLGGEMVSSVSFSETLFNELPYKFEAGTPAIADAIGLHAALDYLQSIGFAAIAQYEQELAAYVQQKLRELPDVQLLATPTQYAPIFFFTYRGVHAHDVATVLDQAGVAVRSGHHCAMPLHQTLHAHATARASLCFYNSYQEADQLIDALQKVGRVFA